MFAHAGDERTDRSLDSSHEHGRAKHALRGAERVEGGASDDVRMELMFWFLGFPERQRRIPAVKPAATA